MQKTNATVWTKSRAPMDAARLRRIMLGVSQVQLAAALGRSPSWVSTRERGNCPASPFDILALHAALDELDQRREK